MDLEQRLGRLLAAVEAALGSGEKDRYTMAMIGRALAVAGRDLESGIDAPERALNRAVYGKATSSLRRLARDLRDRAIHDGNRPDLQKLLSRYVDDRMRRWDPGAS